MPSDQVLPTLQTNADSRSQIPSLEDTMWQYFMEPPLDESYLQTFELSDHQSQGSGPPSAPSSAPSEPLSPSLES